MIKYTFSWKKSILLILSLLLLNGVYGQQNNYESYHNLLNLAKSFSNNDSIVHYYHKAFSMAQPFSKDLKSLSFIYFKSNELRKADKYLIKSICNGYQFEEDELSKDNPFSSNYNMGFIKKYKESKSTYANFINAMTKRNYRKMKRARKKYLTKIDNKENTIFETLLQNEYYFQYSRLNLFPTFNLKENDLEILSKYVGSGNSYLMLNLLENDKFPNRRNCARFNDQSITLLLNHAIAGFANKEDAEKFIKLLWKEVENGNLTPYDYAKAYDHYVGWYIDNFKTYFGTTTMSKEGYDNFVCMDVLYPKKLNEIRKKHWLIPIEEFIEKTGFHLPLNYNSQ